jgi:L-asparaginase/Glu-tRNA(Gln) amidotransferase subunit D
MSKKPSSSKLNPRLIEVIYAGGTISSAINEEGYLQGGNSVDLVGNLKDHSERFEPDFVVGNKIVAYTGLSENLDLEYWSTIDNSCREALSHKPHGILITHGTDSMEQTAQHLRSEFLDSLKANDSRIILTGANTEVDYPDTDVWENLQFALESASSNIKPDVYIAYHGKLVRADKAVKLPYLKDPRQSFISIEQPYYLNIKYDPVVFTTTDDVSYSEIVSIRKNQIAELSALLLGAINRPSSGLNVISYDVSRIRPNHQDILDCVENNKVDVVLLTLYHSGTANADKPNTSVAKLVEDLRLTKGIIFFAVTENYDIAHLKRYETSRRLLRGGVVPLYDMLKDVALAKLGLIDRALQAPEIIDEMLTNRVGELSEELIITDDIKMLKELYSTK